MRLQVLDHGFVEFIEHWGSDARIIEAARMSTNKGFQGWGPVCSLCGDSFDRPGRACPNAIEGSREYIDCGVGRHVFDKPGDEKLLKFLYDNKHATPFEMAGMTIVVQAPIMVFREWHRHRTQSYNEMSARYTPLPDVNYLPTAERCLVVNGKNKQANKVDGAEELTHESALEWLEELTAVYEHAERVYQSGLKRGIPKELARLPVPVGRYSRMMASTDLRNWLSFLTLRMAPNAQQEIRLFAHAVATLLRSQFPRTMELFDRA